MATDVPEAGLACAFCSGGEIEKTNECQSKMAAQTASGSSGKGAAALYQGSEP